MAEEERPEEVQRWAVIQLVDLSPAYRRSILLLWLLPQSRQSHMIPEQQNSHLRSVRYDEHSAHYPVSASQLNSALSSRDTLT